MKIIFVSEFAEATSNSTGLFVRQICQIAKSEGYGVHAVSCDGSNYNIGGSRSIVRLPLKGLLKKIRPLYWFLLSVWLAKQAYAKSSRGDVIVVASNPLFLPLIIAFLGIIYRRRAKALLLFDVFPLNAIATKKFKPESWIAATLVWIFGRVYAAFDAIIVNGRDCLDVINRRKKRARCRVIYVPHFLLEEHLPPRATDTGAFADTSQLRVQYLGNAGPMQGLSRYMLLICNLLSRRTSLNLAMFGNAASSIEMGMLTESVTRRIKTCPEVAFEERHFALGAAEYGLVTLAPGMYGLAVPSKAWFALAAGQGLIVFGDKRSELDLVLSENPRLGVFIASDELDEAVAKITTFIAHDQQEYETRRYLGLEFLQKCREDAVRSYAGLFHDLTSMYPDQVNR